MMHIQLDPLQLTKYHELKTKTELSLAKAKLLLLDNKKVDAYDFIHKADIDLAYLQLFVMICERAFFGDSNIKKELERKGIIKQ